MNKTGLLFTHRSSFRIHHFPSSLLLFVAADPRFGEALDWIQKLRVEERCLLKIIACCRCRRRLFARGARPAFRQDRNLGGGGRNAVPERGQEPALRALKAENHRAGRRNGRLRRSLRRRRDRGHALGDQFVHGLTREDCAPAGVHNPPRARRRSRRSHPTLVFPGPLVVMRAFPPSSARHHNGAEFQ